MSLSFVKTTTTNFKASQQLMDLLIASGFRDCTDEVGYHPYHQPSFYMENCNYRFQKNGSCIISFLKNWSIHLINGPVSRWERFDSISAPHLELVIGFCSLDTPEQEEFREKWGKLRDYDKIILELKNNRNI